ncbi:hypothetical protein JH146_1482 [Methanocaldococcus bathoardescens]|uniref:DUF234 domain-containing protein n=1 Tax=Methanocaldococcus bathoardescens TaxID=1301915 RepID=A0A076LKY6_9EURY|nr:hypothetical protein [Methanocaldococcus bathoardescens]AIJ06324.1 hypothetical protein JH146_1482 [Methanocaldococcus bathoardescens]
MLSNLKLKNEREFKIKIDDYVLRGFIYTDDEDNIYKLFNMALSKIRYRKAVFNNFNLPKIRERYRNREITEKIKENDNYFLELIDRIMKDFGYFCYLSSGTLFELWVYYTVIEFFKEHKENAKIVRNLDVSYKGNSFTEIDLFVEINNKRVIFECKNRYISSNAILKLYGIMKILNVDYGILASTKEFTGNLKKEDIFKEYNIYILDKLIEKEKNKIFKELREVLIS